MGVPGLDIIHAFLQETVKFKASAKLFVSFDAEDCQISLAILRDKDGLAILVAERRYLIIFIPGLRRKQEGAIQHSRMHPRRMEWANYRCARWSRT